MSEFERKRLEEQVSKIWITLEQDIKFRDPEDALETMDELEKKLKQLGFNL
jgi:hypothetical protein